MILVTVTDPKRKLRKLVVALALLLMLTLLVPMLWHRTVSTAAEAEQGSEPQLNEPIRVDGQVWQLESFYLPEIEQMRVQ